VLRPIEFDQPFAIGEHRPQFAGAGSGKITLSLNDREVGGEPDLKFLSFGGK
jgi:hypothetical protein